MVSPDNDTPYSWAWLDLRAEPMVISVPAVPEGRKRFERIGIGPGRPWDASRLPPAELAAIAAGVQDGQAAIEALAVQTYKTNSLFGSREQLGTNYLERDVGDGTRPSVLRSATLYTLPDRFLHANPMDRCSIGDRTRGLVYGQDGSLEIHVGNASPGKDKESNWLPAPAAPYSLVVRVYGPGEAARTGQWILPPLQTVDAR